MESSAILWQFWKHFGMLQQMVKWVLTNGGDVSSMGKVYFCETQPSKSGLAKQLLKETRKFYDTTYGVTLYFDPKDCPADSAISDYDCQTYFIDTCTQAGGVSDYDDNLDLYCSVPESLEVSTFTCSYVGSPDDCNAQFAQYCTSLGGQLNYTNGTSICVVNTEQRLNNAKTFTSVQRQLEKSNGLLEMNSVCGKQSQCEFYFKSLCKFNRGELYSQSNSLYCSFVAEKVFAEAFAPLTVKPFESTQRSILYVNTEVYSESEMTGLKESQQTVCNSLNGITVNNEGTQECAATSGKMNLIDISFTYEMCSELGIDSSKCQSQMKELCDQQNGQFGTTLDGYSCVVHQTASEVCALVEKTANNGLRLVGGCYNDQFTKYTNSNFKTSTNVFQTDLILRDAKDPTADAVIINTGTNKISEHGGYFVGMIGLGMAMILSASGIYLKLRRNRLSEGPEEIQLVETA